MGLLLKVSSSLLFWDTLFLHAAAQKINLIYLMSKWKLKCIDIMIGYNFISVYYYIYFFYVVYYSKLYWLQNHWWTSNFNDGSWKISNNCGNAIFRNLVIHKIGENAKYIYKISIKITLARLELTYLEL
jgi:hypothetical protein